MGVAEGGDVPFLSARCGRNRYRLGVKTFVIIALGVGFFVGILAVVRYGLGRMRVAGRQRMEHDLLRGKPPQQMDDMANFLGLQSVGAVQARGNGCLALGDDALLFAQWVPQRTVVVPLQDVIEVDEADSHLGKSIFKKLLRVRWKVDGREETAAWFVRDLPGWVTALRRVVRPR